MKTTLTLIMIVLCAGMVAVWNINGAQNMNVPPMDGRGYPQTFYQSFKGNPVKPPKMHFVGRDAQEFVKFEPEGLRITLPSRQATPTQCHWPGHRFRGGRRF